MTPWRIRRLPEDLQAQLGQTTTIADRIRLLDRRGYKRAEIARILDKRYQHVRNVLERDGAAAKADAADDTAAVPGPDRVLRFEVAADGTLRLPPEVLRGLDIPGGGLLTGRLSDGRLTPGRTAGRAAKGAGGAGAFARPAEGRGAFDRRRVDRRPPRRGGARGGRVSDCLLDASAALAVLFDEPGAESVLSRLPGGAISAVNLAEVIARLVDNGLSGEAAEAVFQGLMVETRDFTAASARLSGQLRQQTRRQGLSLGDRACLAEAMLAELPVLTADRSWAGLDLGVGIEVIR